MKEVLPIIIICSLGMAFCLAYIVLLCARAINKKRGKNNARDMFEIEDDVLTVKLGKRKKK